MLTQVHMYQRMFNFGAFSASYLLGAVIIFMLLRNKRVGHRTLLRWAACFLCMRSFTMICAAVAVYRQSYDIATWLSTSTALVSFVLFTYMFSVRHDLETTLEESEQSSRVSTDKISDVVMAARNLKIVAKTQRESLHSTISARRRVGATSAERTKRMQAKRGV